MEGVIDTNVLVYDMMEDSELHAKAKEALDNIDVHAIPLTVMGEFVHVLEELNVDSAVISRKIREILENENIVSAGQKEVTEAIGILDKEKTSFKRFNDKLIMATAKGRNMPLLTFDKDLIKECKANGVKLLYE